MKGSVILSLTLDALAVLVILLPASLLSGLSSDPKVIRNIKRGTAILLLLTGFLVDFFISRPG